jgi:predicted phosphohydrolase
MAHRIQYCSDLHLEFRENQAFIKAHPIQPVAPILILGGDIMLFSEMGRHQDFLDYVSDNFERTYWIPGNHEYYHGEASQRVGVLNENIRSNVHLVNNMAFTYADIRLVFSTMWTRISVGNAWHIERNMNDFRTIKYKGVWLSMEVYNEWHQECLSFLRAEIDTPFSGKTLVISHHIPTFFNYPKQYKGDVLNEAFAVELYDLIENSNIAGWIYGHHHCNVPDYKVGNTLMLTNQLGYVKHGENKTFRTDKFVEL